MNYKKEEEAINLYCPFKAHLCEGDECMAWQSVKYDLESKGTSAFEIKVTEKPLGFCRLIP